MVRQYTPLLQKVAGADQMSSTCFPLLPTMEARFFCAFGKGNSPLTLVLSRCSMENWLKEHAKIRAVVAALVHAQVACFGSGGDNITPGSLSCVQLSTVHGELRAHLKNITERISFVEVSQWTRMDLFEVLGSSHA